MKRKVVIAVVLLLACLPLLMCTKVPLEEIRKTRLLITLRDEKGLSVTGTIVRLYKIPSDTGITRVADSTGVLLYPDLDVATYYWLAQNGCKTNLASQTSLKRPLVNGSILYGYSVLAETSTLKLKNNSTETYRLSDSTFTVILPADTSFIFYPKVGRHRLTLVKVTPPASVAKDSVLRFNCGDTIALNVPF